MTSHDPMIETNDPRLTDYVLGELAPSEVAQIEAALKSSPELRAAVADIRAATETITSVFQTEPSLQLSPEQKAELLAEAESANTDVHSFADNVTPTVTGEHYRPSSGSMAHWIKIAVAAGLAGLLLGGAYYFTKTNRFPMAASDSVMLNSAAEAEQEPLQSEDREDDEVLVRELEKLPAQPFNTPKRDSKSDAFAGRESSAAFEGTQYKDSVSKKQADLKPKVARKGITSGKEVAGLGAIRGGEFSDAAKMAQNPVEAMAPSSKASEFKPPAADKAFAKSKSARSKDEGFNAPSNLPMRFRVQQSLDQSILGSLNLKVVAQNAPNQFSPSKGGIDGVVSGDQPTDIGKQSKIETASRGLTINLPTTFKLQISDQAAQQMVQLLANQADPLQQRELSFNELIGLPQSLLDRNDTIADDRNANKYDADDDRELEADSTALAADRVQKKSIAPSKTPQNAAVLMLASKLREYVSQPFYQYKSALADRAFDETGDNEDSLEDRIAETSEIPLGISPSAQQSASNDSLKAPVEPAPSFSRSEPKQKFFAAPKPSQRLRSNEFNYDYTQVIQQLKSKLEIRNKSVNPPKQ